ncbi:MoaF-related domain-containing protein [Burkholderia gladioli]|uniref:MoaF-related domain-containing protein n=1 Tax=Burkholderia gladioli TaxID=28095 RepID=UPI0039B4D432
MRIYFERRRFVAPHTYAISWVEDNGGTVVHVDDFHRHLSRSYYTPRGGELIYSEAVIQ